MHIHALTVDRGGCFYYRIRQPLTELRKLGHWTSWGSGMDRETYERADVVINQLLHHPETTSNWLRWCEEGKKLCVWEVDDDVFTVHTSPHHGNAYDNPETLDRMRAMIRASHLVTVTTPALAEVYRPLNPHVVVLPNAVPDWLPELRGRLNDSDTGRLALGYTGSPSHLHDYEEWSPVLVPHQRRWLHRTQLRYYGLSSRPEGLPTAWPARVVGWHHDTPAYLRSVVMDVGIAPLSDTQFNRGKSPVKWLEYAALGIPAVVQDHPVYRGTVPLDAGFMARTQREWVEGLGSLWESAALRRTIGERARDHVRAHHLASQAAPLWERAYQEAMERIGVR